MVESLWWRKCGKLKLQLEQSRLQLIKEGILSAGDEVTRDRSLSSGQSCDEFDVLGNLRLLPKFLVRNRNLFFLV